MKITGIIWLSPLLGLVTGLLLLTAAWGEQPQSTVSSAGQTWAPASEDVVTSVYKVENLSCSVCLDSIGSELQGLPGTVGLDADLANQVVFIDHQKELSSDKIAERITATGYPAQFLGSGRKVRSVTSNGRASESVAGGGGCNRRACGATAKDWKELFHRYFAK